MKAMLTILFLYSTLFCFAQEKALNNYLLVRIIIDYDKNTAKNFCTINAEGGNEAAKIFYLLKKYNLKKNAVNTEAYFYYNHADTATNFYNFFTSPTEALNFIADNGWTLLSIYTETFSGSDLVKNGAGNDFPITTVSSRPVFCFKK